MKILIPYHVAIIMDGNGRWAKRRGLPRYLGHRKGAARVKEVILAALEMGVRVLTLFAFSTENWKRPEEERRTIFRYLEEALQKHTEFLIQRGVKLQVLGRRDRIDRELLDKLDNVCKLTRRNKTLVLNLALDYGGRWDIVNGVRKVAKDVASGKVLPEDIDEEMFSKYLALGDMPDPDLLIRTSYERRISNFLLWNLAYTELYFPRTLWPDFDRRAFWRAVKEYSRRRRRFGGVNE